MTGSGTTGEIAGVILAGGRARRLDGRNKALLDIAGERIVDRQLRILRAVTSTQLIIANDPSGWDDLGVPVLQDLVPGSGPLAGLHRAFHANVAPRVMLLACDLPFVTKAFLRFLVEYAPGADAVVPSDGYRLQPLCAVYSWRLLPEAEAALGARRLSMHAWVARFATVVPSEVIAPFDENGFLFFNVNTPAEYSDALARRTREGADPEAIA